MISPAQIRAARSLLGWKQTELAAASGLSDTEIKTIEAGLANARGSTLARLEKAFDEAGVVFFDGGEIKDGGLGLRMKSRE